MLADGGFSDGMTNTAPATNSAPETAPSYAPAALPGNGLAQHPFLYTGEWDHRKKDQTIYVVRDGKVAWTFSIPIKDGDGTLQELGDATMLSNGNIVFCRKVGASEITPDKKIIWDMVAPKGTEIHSVQPIGLDRLLVMQNGNPAKLMLINIVTGKTEKELILPVAHPTNSPHLQFRRVHKTKDGTFLAAHLADNKVVEYDADGKEIWSYATRGPWSATRLKNGNTLITTYPNTVLELNRQKEIVWQFSQKDAPEYKFFIFQEAGRLANGNTVICNWCPAHVKDPKLWPGSVQVLEVTPEKKIVWALSEWKDPDLGPASSIQLLDEPGAAENGDLQR
jgi:outer membrane protein assembly factor BamB